MWATYFHKLSTNDNPQHGLCPKGPESWCKFNKAQALNQTYNPESSLTSDVLLSIKKIYQDLSQPDLLKKCLHGRTQNPNESFNNVVWSKIPKLVFVRRHTLKLGVYDAILTFNDGQSSKLAIYKKLGLTLCERSVKALREIDILRVKKAEKATESMSKEARQARRRQKTLLEDENEAGDPDYGAGLF